MQPDTTEKQSPISKPIATPEASEKTTPSRHIESTKPSKLTLTNVPSPSGIVAPLSQDAKCYVSIDIDVLDLPLVPGCVSAEPNGLTYAELRDALFALAEHTEIIGFDLVEVNPQLDIGIGITSYIAAHTILEFLGQICDQPRWVARR